ncbi:protein HipA [Aggregatibacter actinomycetemcomitans serotype f str. D18P1]|nr:protein HipA [Aggregatibacter actinomycetemcomitans D7S-1]KND85191.1 protein HipA [Aggregatibacter actinomycetemcomitans serotype a str. H5P1]KOE30579.1 protein HipA [Aggregatibacter actinomycetemcomitans D17P-3]KOE62876.1 protein HipA [Aggregatibacter actinomycetemcomitans serotype e str. A160]KOE65693.1 protein HipA [Aggregatibacter actinomycetemcomitans serotype e str. SCC393]KOE65847.1 protein HipA [Aggregatibacter actinomycetemcomitans serotype d str. I63B]KOE70757.1 protein HipA [Agg
MLKNYRTFPLGMEESEDFRISLAGAQEKTALLYYQNKRQHPLHSPLPAIFLPIGIVEQEQLNLSHNCENEWLCLKFG